MKKTKVKKFISGLLLCGLSTSVMANDHVLDADPMYVDGYVREQVNVTDQELEAVKNELNKQKGTIVLNKQKARKYDELGRSTEKLANVTERMIDQRKDSKKIISKYNKKIKCLMETDPGTDCDEFITRKMDKVQVKQAAPVIVAQPQNTSTGPSLAGTIKVIPTVGVNSYSFYDEYIESQYNVGLKVESDLNKRFTIGVGFNFTSLNTDLTETNGQILFNNSSRNVDLRNYNVDVSGKFFLIKNNKFRPFIGASLGYNRSVIEYADQGQFNNGLNYTGFYNNLGNEQITSGHLDMKIMLGSEITFTKSMGMNIELGYKKGLGASSESFDNFNSQDMTYLRQLNDNLAEANQFSAHAGLIIYF